MYYSDKIVKGFSTAFRQWKAVDSHCSKLHGYSISFKLYFRAKELDQNNWVQDFGFTKGRFKKNDSLKDWFNRWFDHTTIIDKDDPFLVEFRDLHEKGVINLKTMPGVGCEKFAEFVYYRLRDSIEMFSEGRVELYKVKCIENENNSASYEKS